MSPICSVEGCGRQRDGSLGYCGRHYRRYRRHGDPMGGRSFKGDSLRYFHETVLTYSGSECLIWPYGCNRDGYPRIRVGAKTKLVSRLACEDRHGPPPTTKHEAAHSCGNGHLSCVNPHHLSWKTSSENKMDALRHGTQRNGSKLTRDDVLAIRRIDRSVSSAALAPQFGVGKLAIFRARTGRTWGQIQ